ncbi:MAG: AraC family transcriptional regulator [Chryseobacterium sp.]|nr:MAG: AraC family transcriptional regulator [Chryseobacterium sp.]
MKTIKFHKTECGVEVLLNVLIGSEVKHTYLNSEDYNTDYFEIVLFKKAIGHVILNQNKIDLAENTIVFISPFQKRRWTLNPENLDFTVLLFQENFLNDFFSDKLFTYRLLYFYQLAFSLDVKLTSSEIQKACGVLTEIKEELIEARPDGVHIIRSLTYYLLQKFNRAYARQYGLSLQRAENSYAYQFKMLVESNIYTMQRIDDYAKLMSISRITINQAVKEQFRITATELIKQRLLFEVKNYLIHSLDTISEIAYKLNFSEPNHLMRFFKNRTGCTASEFVLNYRNGEYS